MAKNDVKQLNYTFDEINEALSVALGVGIEYSDDNSSVQLVSGTGEDKQILSSIQNPAASQGGITLKYQEDGKLQMYYKNGSENEADWTPVGDSVIIISADPNAKSYKFNFEPLTPTYSIQVKSQIDEKINYDDLAIKYSIQEIDQNNIIQPTNINATWTISKGNNSRVFSEILRFTPDSSEYSFNWIEKIISDEGFYGTGLYSISVRFVGTDNNFRTQTWQVNITDLQLITNFNDTMVYSNNQQPKVDITIKGNLKKQVKVSLINYSNNETLTEVYKKDFAASTSDIRDSFNLNLSTHGVYGLVFECTGEINKTTIQSPVLYKEFIFIEEGNETPLIRWGYYNKDHLTQYEYENFIYGVYNPKNPNSPINIQLYSENNGKTQNLVITPNNTNYEWMYYAPTYSTSVGGQEFIIRITDTTIENKKLIVVDPFEKADLIQPVGGVVFDFIPVGRTNNDLDKEEYVYEGKNYLTVSEQFDWVNGGWKYDNQNRPYFCVKAGHWADLSYSLFKDDTRTNGKNFKIIFKTTNCRKVDAKAIECYDGKVGFIVKAQNAELFYSGQEASLLDIPYIEDEIIPLEFNIQKDQQMTKPLKSTIAPIEVQPLVTAYLDADPSQTVRFGKTSTGARYNWQQENVSNIRIGSEDCDVWIYRLKAYDTELTNQQILQNYYADSFTGSEGLLKYNNNNILDEYGNIDISQLQIKYPDLHILQIECDNIWPRGKASSDYQACTVTHLMGNGNLKDNWSTRSRIRLQGTSSLEYISSAGNFDINFRDDIKYKHTDGLYYTKSELIANQYYTQEQLDEMQVFDDKYAMTEKSIPVDYFNVKVNVASSENANNSQLADWFNTHNPFKRAVKVNGVRDTMEFHPCIIFIKENSDDPKEFPKTDNFHFYACGDFGNSKKNDDVFGMNSSDPYDCIIEISNNDNPLCLFKTAIFENYQTNTTTDDDGNIIPVTNDIWDGDAVEFRYVNEGYEDLLKEKALRLWKWVYSVDYTKPGIKECFINSTPVEVGDNVVFELLTKIPSDYSTITSVAPNFLLAHQQENSEGQLEWQTFSKFNIYDYIKLEELELNLTINVIDVDGCCKIILTLPKYAVQFSDLSNINPGFFINFKNDYVLNDNFEYVLNKETEKKILDDEKYRLDKFKTEYTNYFEKQSLLFHYLFTERFTMIDNRAKNTFIHTNGNPNEGKEGNVWDYCFNYDNDTALGCNNKGFLTMDYGVEDTDDIHGNILTEDTTPAFNASTSVIWKNVRTLKTELISLFNETTSAWSAISLNNKFEKYQGYKCAQLQMLDMERKYFRPYFSGYYGDDSTSLSNYLPMLQGRKTYQRRRFQKYQEIYCESKYKNPDVAPTSDIFTFRSSLPKESGRTIQPEIIPYIKCYPVLKYDQVGAYTERVWPGQKFKPTGLLEPNDKNFVIYPSKYISELGGLSNAGLETANVSSGAKLLKVDFSNNPNLPEASADSISFGANNALLEEINISKTLAKSVDLTALTNLKIFNAEDTDIISIEFANGGLIREAKLGSATKNLNCVNNSNLEVLTIQRNENNQYNLEVITINNPSKTLNWIDIIDLNNCPKLKEVTILNADYEENNCWSFEDNAWIEQLYALDNAILTGNIYIDQIREHDYNKYLEKWPGLNIKYNEEEGFIPTYKVYYYNNEAKTELLKVEIYDEGEAAIRPTEIPTKESDQQYKYEFKDWSITVFTNFDKDTDIYAIYTAIPRKFTVKWWKEKANVGEPLFEQEYEYGDVATYGGPELQPEKQSRGYYNLFKGWNKSTSFVEEDAQEKGDIINVEAQWEVGNYSKYVTTVGGMTRFIDGFSTKQLNAAEMYSILHADGDIYLSLFSDESVLGLSNFDRISIPLGRTWEFTNKPVRKIIEEPMIFDGSQKEGYDTGIKLFEGTQGKEKDWTLFLDVQYINSPTNSTLVSCFSGSRGFKVNQSGYKYPYVTYNTTKLEPGSASASPVNNNEGDVREVFVITHKGGYYNEFGTYIKPVFTVYSGLLSELQPMKKVLTTSLTSDFNDYSLVFGGVQSRIGQTYIWDYLASGIVHACEMWDEVLSEEECMMLASWPREKAEFTITNFGSIYLDENQTQRTIIDLTAAQTTSAKLKLFESNQNTQLCSFATMYARQWMNTRYFNALPITWQQLIKTINIPCSQTNRNVGTSEMINVETQFYLPSFYELAYNGAEEEGVINPLFGTTTGGQQPGWAYNIRFSPASPMVDVYSESAEWVYKDRDPSGIIQDGSIWIKENQQPLIYNKTWLKWGEQFVTRSTNSHGFRIIQYSNNYVYAGSTATDKCYVLPCFSI